MATVGTFHPFYLDHIDEWKTMRDTMRGTHAVKLGGPKYLPVPSGFADQGVEGGAMYEAYLTRAKFPNIVAPTIRGMVGLIHRIPAQVTLPDQLKPMYESATRDGMPLETFHRQLTTELLTQGRYGILCDASPAGADVPYLVGYTAEMIINWSRERDFFVCDESGMKRYGFIWVPRIQHRCLTLDDDGVYHAQEYQYHQLVMDYIPQRFGGKPFMEIPFVIANPFDLSVTPQQPPAMNLAESALAAYRLDADYRHQLFWSGQETLVCTGLPEAASLPKNVGSGTIIGFGPGQDAKYIGPHGTGINAHRQALQDEAHNAIAAGAQLFDIKSGFESGEALRLRYSQSNATLTTISLSSGAALEKALRWAAMYVGANPLDVNVTPNLKFVDTVMQPREGIELVTMWQAGAISYRTLYENLQRGEIASPDRESDEELALIEVENPLGPPTTAGLKMGINQGTGGGIPGAPDPAALKRIEQPEELPALPPSARGPAAFSPGETQGQPSDVSMTPVSSPAPGA